MFIPECSQADRTFSVARDYPELEARRIKLSHVNDGVGIVDGLTGIATNIAGYVYSIDCIGFFLMLLLKCRS